MNVISPITDRSVISLSGPDRASFLQGLISNDVKLCTKDTPLYASLLTPQGKFLHEFFVLFEEDRYLIDCEAERAGDLLKRLFLFKLRAKIILEDLAHSFDIFAAFGGEINPRTFSTFLTYQDPRHKKAGWRVLVKKGTPLGHPVSNDLSLYETHRIELGLPKSGAELLLEKSTLLECNMDRVHAISWTKGCYIGQELTARMYHRALLKKRLYSVAIDGKAPLIGTLIEQKGEIVGEMRSAMRNRGLAILNIEKADIAQKDGSLFEASGALLRPLPDPYDS